jgi:hypothetical protein
MPLPPTWCPNRFLLHAIRYTQCEVTLQQNSLSANPFFAKCTAQKGRLLFWLAYFIFASKTDNPYNNGYTKTLVQE